VNDPKEKKMSDANALDAASQQVGNAEPVKQHTTATPPPRVENPQPGTTIDEYDRQR
jgi:hypothetical protein